MDAELREKVRAKLHRQTKLGESERTCVAQFLLDLLDDADMATDLDGLLDECDELASAAYAAKTDLRRLAGPRAEAPPHEGYRSVPLTELAGKLVTGVDIGTTAGQFGSEPCAYVLFADGTKHGFVLPSEL